jgi:hypothetical protein
MDRGDCQKRVKASRHALPADPQAAGLLLEPGQGARGLQPGHAFFDRSAPVLLRLPDPLRDLCPDTALPQGLPQRFGLLPLLRRDDLETFPGAPPFARAALDCLEPRPPLGPRIPVGRRGAVRQGPAVRLCATVEQAPWALAPAGDALAATLPRGKKRRQWRHTPHASCPVPRPRQASALAWRRGSHRPARAATTDASRSSSPRVAHGGRHPSGSRYAR